MKVVVFSYKVCWADPNSPSGYVADGGFPFQMQAIAEIFDSTRLVILRRKPPVPAGTRPLTGHNLEVTPLPEPGGSGWRRKLALCFWLPSRLPGIWSAICQADAVHALVPGDLGFIGILLALAQRKPLCVRHCGAWGQAVTLADRFTFWLLERIAGGRNAVFATGGAANPPSQRNPHIRWIFSTTLTRLEMENLPLAQPWHPGQPLRLVSVGRLTAAKNAAAVIQALPLLRERLPQVSLDLLGAGPVEAELRLLAERLGVGAAVTFHGNLPHSRVLEILSASHLFVFPTRVKEGFPKALLEAMACGLPAIATAVSVIPHLLRDDAGLVLQSTATPAVAEAILQLTADPARLRRMGEHARQRAQEYTLEAWAEAIGERLRPAWGCLRQPTGGQAA